MSLAIGWAVCLSIAFIIYPEPDNLVVGYFVYLIFGEDGLGRLSGVAAFVISTVQVLVMYCVGHVAGLLIWHKSRRDEHG